MRQKRGERNIRSSKQKREWAEDEAGEEDGEGNEEEEAQAKRTEEDAEM